MTTSFGSIIKKIKNESKDSKLVTYKPKIGRMCCYQYNPKTKDKLPYYDIFPLVIPVDYTNNGFYGINFHYLDKRSRLKLLEIINPFNEIKKDIKSIKISYQKLLVLGTSIWKPCFKRYLLTHIRTKIIDIPKIDWKDVMNVPVVGFRKSSASNVYKISRKF